MQSLWSSLLVFILILAAIPVSAWLLRRSQQVGTGASGSLGVFCAVAVGTRERIAIVRADRKWLVVGVTAQSISLLAELDQAPEGFGPDEESPIAQATGRRFADLLARLPRNASHNPSHKPSHNPPHNVSR